MYADVIAATTEIRNIKNSLKMLCVRYYIPTVFYSMGFTDAPHKFHLCSRKMARLQHAMRICQGFICNMGPTPAREGNFLCQGAVGHRCRGTHTPGCVVYISTAHGLLTFSISISLFLALHSNIADEYYIPSNYETRKFCLVALRAGLALII